MKGYVWILWFVGCWFVVISNCLCEFFVICFLMLFVIFCEGVCCWVVVGIGSVC